jgi:serine/threonine-protein kinase HipA
MTTSERSDRARIRPPEAFVWVWLPGATSPVVAGKLIDRGEVVTFTYGRSYLDRHDAIPLYLPELPLEPGEHFPLSGTMPGCIADAGPDAWGRRVIEHRFSGVPTDLGPLAYLLESGSNRIGAMDFQRAPDRYEPRTADHASLADLAEAARLVDEGKPVPSGLASILVHGSSIGGARPKALLDDPEVGDAGRGFIAKFSSTSDTYPVVKAEFIAMALARQVGLDVPAVQITRVAGRDVLLVRRFDRSGPGTRRLMVSALTILELHDALGLAGRYATYVDLADQVRARFTNPDATLRELFGRMTFNVLVGNTDDHPRNHAAFWDGHALTLTPAYDICPQPRIGEEAAQAMAFGRDRDRTSQVARCLRHATAFHLSTDAARDIIDKQIGVIHDAWDEVCEQAGASRIERERMWGRQFLNPFSLYGYQ